MLVISRKAEETVVVPGVGLQIKVLLCRSGRVRLGSRRIGNCSFCEGKCMTGKQKNRATKPAPQQQTLPQSPPIAVTLGTQQWKTLASWSRHRSGFLTEFAKAMDQLLTTHKGLQLTVKRPYEVWTKLVNALNDALDRSNESLPWLFGLIRVIVVKISDGDEAEI